MIQHFDLDPKSERLLIARHLPDFESHLDISHYRNVEADEESRTMVQVGREEGHFLMGEVRVPGCAHTVRLLH